MPMYSFRCEECDTVFEIRASIKEKLTGLNPTCPKCHSLKVQQLITAGLLIYDRKVSGQSLPTCNPNAGGGCCR